MTFKMLTSLIKKYRIPEDVTLMFDSGWENGSTDMNGVYFCREKNVIVFTQEHSVDDKYWDDDEWIEIK